MKAGPIASETVCGAQRSCLVDVDIPGRGPGHMHSIADRACRYCLYCAEAFGFTTAVEVRGRVLEHRSRTLNASKPSVHRFPVGAAFAVNLGHLVQQAKVGRIVPGLFEVEPLVELFLPKIGQYQNPPTQ